MQASPSYLAEDEHVLALLVGDPVDGLLHLLGLVHPLEVLLQDLLVEGDLGGVGLFVEVLALKKREEGLFVEFLRVKKNGNYTSLCFQVRTWLDFPSM